MIRRRTLLGLGAALLAGCSSALTPRPRLAAGTTRVPERYGTGRLQRGEWWLPDRPGSLPTVLLVHGGYWRPEYDRSLEDAVAADLCGRGYLCWNIDYAAADRPWPATFVDVAAGFDHLMTGSLAGRVDRRRIAVVGHSAGGHLALWLASRRRLRPGSPGAPGGGYLAPRLAIGQAPVAALAEAAQQNLGGGAVAALMGGLPAEVPERYDRCDPVALLPTSVSTVLIHGRQDATVPISQSRRYVDLAGQAGDQSRLATFDGGHFEHLDPRSTAVNLLRSALADGLGQQR